MGVKNLKAIILHGDAILPLPKENRYSKLFAEVHSQVTEKRSSGDGRAWLDQEAPCLIGRGPRCRGFRARCLEGLGSVCRQGSRSPHRASERSHPHACLYCLAVVVDPFDISAG